MATCKDCRGYDECKRWMSETIMTTPGAEKDCDDFRDKNEPIVDPHWSIQPKGEIPYRCSNCGCESMRASRYCPDCGKEVMK